MNRPTGFPLKPLRVQGEWIVLDKKPDWRLNVDRYVARIKNWIFVTKCRAGVKKNKLLARLR